MCIATVIGKTRKMQCKFPSKIFIYINLKYIIDTKSEKNIFVHIIYQRLIFLWRPTWVLGEIRNISIYLWRSMWENL